MDRAVARLVYRQRRPGGRAARFALKAAGVDFPTSVRVGPGLKLPHATTGMVIHPNTTIGERVTIFHNVTIGRANIWETADADRWGGARIEDDAVLCAGAVVLIRDGATITVGRGSVVGSNAVLTESTGEWEVWAGAPARLVGKRDQEMVTAE